MWQINDDDDDDDDDDDEVEDDDELGIVYSHDPVITLFLKF